MRRVLLLLLALLIPMQSAVAAVVTIAGMPNIGCEQTLSAKGATVTHGMGAVSDCDCGDHGAAPGGGHGSMHHSCPHFGIATIAMPCTALPAIFSLNAPVPTEHASFDSVVLRVPSPPPTFLI